MLLVKFSPKHSDNFGGVEDAYLPIDNGLGGVLSAINS
ncbi:hypothetical protein D082_10750 [Synechocystis sp. PCC 6714]|nr:hypothetical protein D082_10750 [Synechocystis sp. PCC 6714]